MFPRPCQLLLAAFVVALATVGAARAEELGGPLPIEAALRQLIPSYQAPIALAPDGRWAVLTVVDPRRRVPARAERFSQFTSTGAVFDEEGSDLWLFEIATGSGRNLTAGRGANWGASWSPDGRLVAFYSDRDGAARLWTWDAATGEQRRLANAIVRPAFAFEIPRWSPVSKEVLVKLLPEGETLGSAAARVDVQQPKARTDPAGGATEVTVRVYHSPAPSGSEPVSNLEFKRGDLAVVTVATGAVDRIVPGVPTMGYWFAPDGSRVAFTVALAPATPATADDVYDINIFTRADRSTRRVARRVVSQWGTNVAWSPDGTRLAFGTQGRQVKDDCLVVAAVGGEPTNLTSGIAGEFGEVAPMMGPGAIPPHWAEDGRTLYSVARGHLWAIPTDGGSPRRVTIDDAPSVAGIVDRGYGTAWAGDSNNTLVVRTRDKVTKREGFARIDLASGRCTPLLDGDQKLSAVAVAADGRSLAYLTEDATHPTDLWAAPADFRTSHQASHLNPQLEAYRHGQSHLVAYRSLDGRPLQGALLLPPDHAEGQRHPLVVQIYPGSSLSGDLNAYGLGSGGVDNLQLLATRGYAVLAVDLPVDRASVPTDLLKMVVPGVERVVDLGFADRDRVGIIGHSFGGFGVLSLITQTTRFRVAVASSGIGDLVSHYGQMTLDGDAQSIGWAEDGQIQLGGPPWDHPWRYVAQSPIFHLDRIETPLLIVGGALDSTTPSANMAEVFVGLRRLNKEATMIIYDGEEHWPGMWGFANSVDYANRLIAWFDAHIGPSSPVPVSLPHASR